MSADRRHGHEAAIRLAIAALVTAFFLLGYFGVSMATVPHRAASLSTPLDRRIPFIPATVWFYLWSYSAALIPLFFVNCSRLFRLTALAYCAAIAISLLCFLAVPVTAAQLRVNADSLNRSNFSEWAVLVVYSLDPSYNLFPSLHVSLTTLAAMAARKANKYSGAIFFFGLGLVVISVCTVKQHFVLDAVAGLILGASLGTLILPASSLPASTNKLAWRGPMGYVAFLLASYSGFYLLYRASQVTGFPAAVRHHATVDSQDVPPAHQWLGNPMPGSPAILWRATPPDPP